MPGLVIDTTNLPVADVAERIRAEAEIRIAEVDQACSSPAPGSFVSLPCELLPPHSPGNP